MGSVRSVLIVDDDAAMCEMLAEHLAEAGWRVCRALGVDEALSYLGLQRFAAVVSDIRMAPRDGWDLLRNLRERAETPPVILMSSFAPPTVAIRAREEGAFDYLSKPFDVGDLLALLERVA
jgi:DNA-binding response OmpR family regulator